MNGLWLVSYNNSLILCVCLSVCLSHLRSREREVVSPSSLRCLEALRLASCTNRFSSLHDAPFQRESLCKFFASHAPSSVHAPLHFPSPWAGSNPAPQQICYHIILQRNVACRLPWAESILPTTSTPLESSPRLDVQQHALYIMGSVVAIGLYVNGC